MDAFRDLREAVEQLCLEPEEQRRALARMVVTDELAMDLHYSLEALGDNTKRAGVGLDDDVVIELRRLSALLDVPPGDPLWDEPALDTHPTWAELRLGARAMLPRFPVGQAALPPPSEISALAG